MSLWSNLASVARTFATSRNRLSYLANVIRYSFLRNSRTAVLKLRPDLTLVTGGRSASTGCAVLFDVYYEPRLMYFVDDYLRPEQVFVDIGANIGIYSLLAARKTKIGRVLAIEANPTVFERLQRNVKANNLRNLEVLNCAVTEVPGDFSFHTADGDCEGRLQTVGTSAMNTITVKGQPLTEILCSQGIEHVDCVKLDVEGAELAVLQGAKDILLAQKPLILIDYYERPLTNWLAKYGYAPYRYVRGRNALLEPVDADADAEHGSIFIHSERLSRVIDQIRSNCVSVRA